MIGVTTQPHTFLRTPARRNLAHCTMSAMLAIRYMSTRPRIP